MDKQADNERTILRERHVYKNAPIREALCELSFIPFEHWNPSRVGQFYERIRGRFDGAPVQESIFQATAPHGNQVRISPLRSKFVSADGRYATMLTNNTISVHAMPPYGGWSEEFRPVLEETLAHWVSVAGDMQFEQVVVRYINDLVFDIVPDFKMEDYLHNTPTVPAGMSNTLASVLNQFQVLDDNCRSLVQVTLSVQPDDGTVRVVLDIVVNNQPASETLGLAEALQRIEELRQLERGAFEACITDKLREKFDA
jgi:uncharacterized protein (TIGR04255 family)